MSRRIRRLLGMLVLQSVVPLGTARAEERLTWNEEWPRFRTSEYVFTGVFVGFGIALEYATVQPKTARWEGPLPGDSPVRNLLVGTDRKTRQVADFTSDVGWMVAQFYPQVVDALFVTYLLDDRNFDVAWQLSWMNVEAMAVGYVLTRGSHRLFARERPLKHSCGSDAAYDELCPFGGTAASFISGHASMAFVGAGLTCVHHQYLPLYGGAAADLAACIGVTSLATTTGILRVVADRHYASDVVAGALLGFGIGYGLPWLLHYRDGAPLEVGARTQSAISYAPAPLTWSGSF